MSGQRVTARNDADRKQTQGLTLTCAVALALALIATVGGASSQPPPVEALFERYSRGETVDDPLRTSLSTPAAFRVFLRGLERQTRTAPAPLVAAFALKAASLAFEEPFGEIGNSLPPDPFSILEVGCAALRRAPSRSDFDLRWQVLAADIITSGTRSRQLSAETMHITPHSPPAIDRHFEHVSPSHRSDPQLALRLGRFAQARFYIWRLTWGVAVVQAQRELHKEFARSRLEATLSSLASLLAHPEFGDEARVRSGDVLLHLGREAEALALLNHGPAKDATWEYFRRFIRARHFMDHGNRQEAAQEYRAALAVNPAAHSAKLALAGLTYVAGQLDATEELMKVPREIQDQDAWLTYIYPGGTNIKARLAALQKDSHADR